ncbi:hypothetical protein AMAG_02480 [Allomyces macrogynus ATCC 38327]|uniref:Uncharacterized protein n=1 Tax=Allomyces macrogynus (strain ATCC 38327) TaxID=578462 RepID=A0A0L0S2B9_ALLM3|nr:hypothetical protein AMAG_02480 [Allomyces macrogynus ATCC 38327]|eukprot:KNE56698.1 hypothetical protein AMAG_02480 [Allomyces macrogynus ATCC 38327]
MNKLASLLFFLFPAVVIVLMVVAGIAHARSATWPTPPPSQTIIPKLVPFSTPNRGDSVTKGVDGSLTINRRAVVKAAPQESAKGPEVSEFGFIVAHPGIPFPNWAVFVTVSVTFSAWAKVPGPAAPPGTSLRAPDCAIASRLIEVVDERGKFDKMKSTYGTPGETLTLRGTTYVWAVKQERFRPMIRIKYTHASAGPGQYCLDESYLQVQDFKVILHALDPVTNKPVAYSLADEVAAEVGDEDEYENDDATRFSMAEDVWV